MEYMNLAPDRWTADPWERNLGCRISTSSACVPSGFSSGEAEEFCEKWFNNHCGGVTGNGYLVNEGSQNGFCKLQVKGEHTVFVGLAPSKAKSLDVEHHHTYGGCYINFMIHPPISQDGTKDGCSWFIDEFCPGKTVSDFEIAVSGRRDTNGNQVCAMKPKRE
jgi:hypothetical protein